MRVLVLGATGRLGKMLQWGWRRDSRISPIWQGRRAGISHDYRQLDILCQFDSLRKAATDSDVVLCLAGVTPFSGGDLSHNVDLALAAKMAAGNKPLLVASSAAVYGRAHGLCREQDIGHPAAPYGAAKLAMERALQTCEGPITCLRIGNVAGADQILGRLPMANAPTIDRFSDGRTPRRSYVGPASLSAMLADLCMAAGSGQTLPRCLNLTSPGSVEMGELLDAVPQHWVARPAPVAAIPEVVLDTALLGRFITLDPLSGTADRLVAEWRAFQNWMEQ